MQFIKDVSHYPVNWFYYGKQVAMLSMDVNVSLDDQAIDLDFAQFKLAELNHNMTMAVLPVTIFIGLECLIGLFGNVLILLVYSSRYERSNFRYFVLSMAVVDLTSCLTTLPGEIFSQLNWYTYEHAWICKVKSFFNVLTVWASASILFCLAFDRYRKICHPLAWQLRQSIALKCCLISVVIAAIVASPITILWGRQDYTYVDGNLMLNVSVCEKSGRYAQDIYPLLYIVCVYILPIGIMLFVVCVLNVLTAKTLFCDIGDLRRRLYKESSVTTLQNMISTISVGNIFQNSKRSTDSMESTDSSNIQLNIQCTDVDIWLNSSTQSNTNASLCRSNSTATMSDSCSAFDVTQLCCKTLASKSQAQGQNNNAAIETSVSTGDSDDTSVTIVIDSCEAEQTGTSLTLTSESTSPSSESSVSLRSLSSRRGGRKDSPELKRKRKTIIMLVLTSVFVATMLMYVVMISLVADSDGKLKNLSNSKKAWFFFFLRMYFINCLVNPILYGFLDPRFRSGLKVFFKRNRK